MALLTSVATSVRYGFSSGISFASLAVLRTRSSMAGPTPHPVVPMPLKCARLSYLEENVFPQLLKLDSLRLCGFSRL
jgi:hypothetical protein